MRPAPALAHTARGVDHAAFPTFDPRSTITFYRDVLGFPVMHATCGLGSEPAGHPDFVRFFFDVGNGGRLAFCYYFGLDPYEDTTLGPAPRQAGQLAIQVDSEDDLREYRRRLADRNWPCEAQVRHEALESIRVTDPNGYHLEITRPPRPVTTADAVDANISVDALMDIAGDAEPTLERFYVRRAALIAERYADEPSHPMTCMLRNLDRPTDADACRQAGRHDAERAGDLRTTTLPIGAAVHHYWLGRWDDAVAELDSISANSPKVTNFGPRERGALLLYHGVLALIAVQRDNRDLVRTHLKAGFTDPIEIVSAWANSDLLLAAQAYAAERSGDLVRAFSLLARTLATKEGQMTPVHPWLPDLVRIAVATGDTATARAALDLCGSEAAREKTPARVAAHSRCRGLLFSDTDALLDAAAHYREVGRLVELAQSLEDAAVHFAAAEDVGRARELLKEVATIYTGLGANWCLRRANTRLRRFGIRHGAHGPRRQTSTGWEALSRTELAVAYLIGEGLSNPDIAAELFLARGTVQCHVSHILAKLGLRSRIEVVRQVMKHPRQDMDLHLR
jgi:DNA-binding CsgD family transcriptional regulator/catechol 2,3-dioxygenase-like lactoylglutathione lyase family enzyme